MARTSPEPAGRRLLYEAVRWIDDRRELKLLPQRPRIPLAGGESEPTSYGCRTLPPRPEIGQGGNKGLDLTDRITEGIVTEWPRT